MHTAYAMAALSTGQQAQQHRRHGTEDRTKWRHDMTSLCKLEKIFN